MQFYKITYHTMYLTPWTHALLAKLAICRNLIYKNNIMMHKCVERKSFYYVYYVCILILILK